MRGSGRGRRRRRGGGGGRDGFDEIVDLFDEIVDLFDEIMSVASLIEEWAMKTMILFGQS